MPWESPSSLWVYFQYNKNVVDRKRRCMREWHLVGLNIFFKTYSIKQDDKNLGFKREVLLGATSM